MKSIIVSTLIFMIATMTVNISAAPVSQRSNSEIVAPFGCLISSATNKTPFCKQQ
ncbi:hypothetical protein BD408DRAFT_417529 [Parasitella parasitica]|nr:hypothetical protein BD408DRAFT_417529 [Parasitella parasitica]